MIRLRNNEPIWCDYCNAGIKPAMVRACLRKTCKTKKVVDRIDRAMSVEDRVNG